ncbi:MAG: hypothetical protein JXR96_21225 [Deltaproteobacteria bacterium]|nr:hypothetical protein [Deltaproteobacteria bacterium]
MLAGLSAALAAREQFVRDASLWRNPYLPGVVLYLTLVPLPVTIYLFATQPAWASLYFFGPSGMSSWQVVLVCGGSVLLGAGGLLLGALLVRVRALFGWIPTVLVALALGASCVLFAPRLATLAPDASWEQSKQAVLSSSLGVLFAFAVPLVLAGLSFLLVLFGMEGRKLRRLSQDNAMEAAPLELPATRSGPQSQ